MSDAPRLTAAWEALPADRQQPAALLAAICSLQTPPSQVLRIWSERFHGSTPWRGHAPAYEVLARWLLAASAPRVALEVACEGLESWPDHVLLRQIQGLALARTGATEEARGVLEAVWHEIRERTGVDNHVIEETLGTLARVYKDLALADNTKPLREELAHACRLYEEAFRRTGGYWTGINVATLATLLGDHPRACEAARDVRRQCLARLQDGEQGPEDRYWLLATVGEAALNLHEWAEAERYYREAGQAGSKRFGDLSSTKQQARLLLAHFGRDAAVLDGWLPIPKVVVFAGHMIDRPGRSAERFPARLETNVYRALRDWLQREHALVGFSSAACGADMLFQEALHELGGEACVVLPYGEQPFRQDSVEIVSGGDWGRRYERVLERAARVVYASSTKLEYGSLSYEYADQLVHGLGLVRARELDTQPVGLAVWDGQPGDGPGGTASVVNRWHRSGLPVWRVDLSRTPPASDGHVPVIGDGAPADTPAPGGATAARDHRVLALFFADAVGFSQLTDPEIPRFVHEYLGRFARLIDRYTDSVVVRETWGDGLFLAFSSARDAGQFAMALAETVKGVDWKGLGFTRAVDLRMALHAGPVYLSTDPITGLARCSGTHMSRAARLEPKTPPGQVYASEAFAALAALENVENFACDYLKQLEWAKHYGTFPTYVVRRRP